MSIEQYANNAQTTLSGSISSGATSLSVASATGFPAAPFRVLIDGEIFLVTAVSGTTFTVTPGQESTAQAAHTNGVAVTHIVTAAALQGFANAICPAGMLAPSAGLTIPAGWILCNGSAQSRTAFAALFAAITFTEPGTTTSGSAVVTATTNTANMFVGMGVSGPGIPSGTTIASINSTTQITLSANATASASTTLTFCPYGAGDGSTTFNVPDMVGRVVVGMDASSVRLSNAHPVTGQSGGEERHSLTSAENGPHAHSIGGGSSSFFTNPGAGSFAAGAFAAADISLTDSSGSGTAHNTMQPWLSMQWMIKT